MTQVNDSGFSESDSERSVSSLGKKREKWSLEFGEKIDFKDVGFVISLAHSSRKLNTIIVETEGGERTLNRPYVHAFIRAPKHNFKTAHANALLAKFPESTARIDHVTYAGLTGTVTEKGELVMPDIVRYRGRTVVMDETVRDRHGEATRAFLQLLENNSYSRKIGRAMKRQSFTFDDGTGAWYKAEDGLVEVYSPFVMIMLSMYSLTYTASTPLGDALLDRMFTIQYETTREQRDLMRRGLFKFQIEDFNCSREVRITREQYQELLAWQDMIDPQLNPRVLDNMIRAFAILQRHDQHVYELMANAGRSKWVKEEGGQ